MADSHRDVNVAVVNAPPKQRMIDGAEQDCIKQAQLVGLAPAALDLEEFLSLAA